MKPIIFLGGGGRHRNLVKCCLSVHVKFALIIRFQSSKVCIAHSITTKYGCTAGGMIGLMCIVSVCNLNILPLTLHQVVPCRPRRLLLTPIAVTSVTRYFISAGSDGIGVGMPLT